MRKANSVHKFLIVDISSHKNIFFVDTRRCVRSSDANFKTLSSCTTACRIEKRKGRSQKSGCLRLPENHGCHPNLVRTSPCSRAHGPNRHDACTFTALTIVLHHLDSSRTPILRPLNNLLYGNHCINTPNKRLCAFP